MARPTKRPRLASTLVALALVTALWRSPAWAHDLVREDIGGREAIVYLPSRLPPMGSRALVVVLHGGLGNAERIADQRSESGLNLDDVAEQNGFIVAYLEGTPAGRLLGDRVLAWNAGGGCCGLPWRNGVDDVAYIKTAVDRLAGQYGVDRSRVFGMGHSNGGMMTQRLVCETTLYAAAVAISGPLTLETARCPAAKGRRVLAIHGADDQNVPLAGGRGTRGVSGVAFPSEARSRQVFEDSGATYTLQIVAGADHMLNRIQAAIQASEGVTIAQKAAGFFGLLK